MSGYYLMHRGWMDNPVFGKEPFTERMAWCWIIEEASWKKTAKRLGMTLYGVERGQFIHSLRYLGEAWGWGKDRVSRFLSALQACGMIRVESATGSATAERRVTVCNYDKYQAVTDSGETAGQTAPRQQRDSGETDKKEGNEGKEGNIEPPLSPQPKSRKKGSSIPDDWSPSAEAVAFAQSKGNSADQIAALTESFPLHHRAKGTISKDWDASWRTWVLNDIRFHGDPRRRQSSKSPETTHGSKTRRSFADEMRAIDAAVSSSRHGHMDAGRSGPCGGDGTVIDGEFKHV